MILEKPHTERNRKYLDWICTLPCTVCGGRAEPHHEGEEGNGGMGMKCSDYDTVPLCRDHHQYRHLVGRKSFWDFWEREPKFIIKILNAKWKQQNEKEIN